MIQGVSFLHNMRSPVVHGDFKPSDVLLTAKEGDNVKLFNTTVSREFFEKQIPRAWIIEVLEDAAIQV